MKIARRATLLFDKKKETHTKTFNIFPHIPLKPFFFN